MSRSGSIVEVGVRLAWNNHGVKLLAALLLYIMETSRLQFQRFMISQPLLPLCRCSY